MVIMVLAFDPTRCFQLHHLQMHPDYRQGNQSQLKAVCSSRSCSMLMSNDEIPQTLRAVLHHLSFGDVWVRFPHCRRVSSLGDATRQVVRGDHLVLCLSFCLTILPPHVSCIPGDWLRSDEWFVSDIDFNGQATVLATPGVIPPVLNKRQLYTDLQMYVKDDIAHSFSLNNPWLNIIDVDARQIRKFKFNARSLLGLNRTRNQGAGKIDMSTSSIPTPSHPPVRPRT